MAKPYRGFASMDPEEHRKLASKAGKAAHAQGTAHKWTVEEARNAGRKGGSAIQRLQTPKPQEETSSAEHFDNKSQEANPE